MNSEMNKNLGMYIDCGANVHLSNHVENMFDINYESTSIEVANSTKLILIGKGKLKLLMHDGYIATLSDVFISLDAPKSLISSSKANEEDIGLSLRPNTE